MKLSELYHQQYVGMPFAGDDTDCKLYIFHDIENFITMVRSIASIEYLITFTYKNGVWKEQSKLELDIVQFVVPLSPSDTLALDMYGRVTAYNHTLVNSDTQEAVVFDVEPLLCRLTSNRFLLYADDTLQLYHVDAESGFSLMHESSLSNVNRFYPCDGATVMYTSNPDASGEKVVGILDVAHKVVSSRQVCKCACMDVVPLTSTSFITIDKEQGDFNVNSWNANAPNSGKKLVYDTGKDTLSKVCKLSATGVLIYDGLNYYLCQYHFEEWMIRLIHNVHQGVTTVLGVNVDNSFVYVKRTLAMQEIVVCRQKGDVTHTVSDELKDTDTVHMILHASNTDRFVCLVHFSDSTTVFKWDVVNMHTGSIQESVLITLSDVQYVHVVHSYIVFYTALSGVLWFEYLTGNEHMHVFPKFTQAFQLEHGTCIADDDSVTCMWPDKGLGAPIQFDSRIVSGFSNDKESLVLYFEDKRIKYFYVSREAGLQLKAEHRTSKDIGRMQWDYVSTSLNFFYEDYSNLSAWHAVLNPDDTYSYQLVKQQSWGSLLSPLQEYTWLRVGDQFKRFEPPVCLLEQQRVLTLKHEGNLDIRFLTLKQYCMWSQCTEPACMRQTRIYGTRCESCESNVALKESKCEVLNAMPSCVPHLDEFEKKVGIHTTTIPAGTLLFHATLATSSVNQDPSKPVHKVFYEEGRTPKSTGLVYFCVNPWISLTQHFYHRGENVWVGDGDYSKLIGSNTEREILENSVRNGRPGALCVYRTTQELKLINTTGNAGTRFKKNFCRMADLQCRGDEREYQNNDFGIVCWALNKGMDGMLSIDQNDPIEPIEHGCMSLKKPIQTELAHRAGGQSSVKASRTMPSETVEINGVPYRYTWEIVLSDFDSKLELVTWIDATLMLDRPKTPVQMYNEMKAQLQKQRDTNLWKAIGVKLKIQCPGFTMRVFVNINTLFAGKEKLDKRTFVSLGSGVDEVINMFMLDVVGRLAPFQMHKSFDWKDACVAIDDPRTTVGLPPANVRVFVFDAQDAFVINLQTSDLDVISKFDRYRTQ